MEMEKAPAGVLQLAWTWSVHDVLAVANVMVLGAIFASVAGAGNEPPFCASFAGGLALRFVAYGATPRLASQAVLRALRSFKLELVGVDECASRNRHVTAM